MDNFVVVVCRCLLFDVDGNNAAVVVFVIIIACCVYCFTLWLLDVAICGVLLFAVVVFGSVLFLYCDSWVDVVCFCVVDV